jgi:hypothetical protein
MKKCPYCGAEYPEDALACSVDQTPFDQPDNALQQQSPPKEPEYTFAPLSDEDKKRDFVTLLTCLTLADADMIVSQLDAAGINAFLPDESLMQITGWNLNTYGYVRVQISPKDYEAARELLSGEARIV